MKPNLDHPILSTEQEQELIERIHAGDTEAQGTLIAHNERLVYKIAKRYIETASRDVELDDLIHEGRMGLLHAADKWSFKLAKKRNVNKFSTYATWWIMQFVRRKACRHRSGFSRSVELDDLSYTVNNTKARLLEELEREPTETEVSERSGVKGSKVHAIMSTPSLLHLDWWDEEGFAKHEITADPLTNVENVSEANVMAGDMLKRLEEHNANYARVVRMLFGINNDGKVYTAAEVARALNITRERVRQIRESAFEFLRT